MNITLTGASGFIGQQLVPFLHANGHNVTAISRQKTATDDCKEIVMSLDDLNADNFPQTDVFIHLAGLAHSKGKLDRELYNHVNTDLPVNIARLAVRQNVKQFVFLSTSKVHGEETPTPFVAASPFEPKDLYSETKAAAETQLKQLASDAMSIVAIRPPVVYGKDPKANIASLLSACKNNKPLPLPKSKNRRSFLYIGNLCEAIETITKNPRPGYKGYVLDDGTPISTEALVSAISDAVSSKPRIIRVPNSAMLLADKIFEKTIGRPMLKPLYADFEIDSADFFTDYSWTPPYDLHTGIEKSFGQTRLT